MSFVQFLLVLQNFPQHDPRRRILWILLNCVANVLFGLIQFFAFKRAASLLVLAPGLPRNSQPDCAHAGAAGVRKFPWETGIIFDYLWLWQRLRCRD
jgi:hypothetical protein